MASCCQENDGTCYHLIECEGKDVICITEPRCSKCPETEESDDENDKDILPFNSTEIYRMPRRSDSFCIVNDISSLSKCCNGKNQCEVTVDESYQKFCQEKDTSLEIIYNCVKKASDCPSISTSLRPGTASTSRRVNFLTTSPPPVPTSTPSPVTYKSTKTVPVITTSPRSSSVSTSTFKPNPRSLSTTLRVQTSTTGKTPRVRGDSKEELSILDTSSIIVIAIGSLALLVLIILIAILLHRKRKAFKMENNKANVGNNPHYFTIEEFPNNQYDQINDVNIPPPTDDYNVLGEDNSVKTNQFNDYNHISSAVANGQVGLNSSGYNHIVLANDSSPKILDNDYNHIKLETDDYNRLRGHNSFKNPKADSYHHILRPNDDEGKV